jgi:hypothetical protein
MGRMNIEYLRVTGKGFSRSVVPPKSEDASDSCGKHAHISAQLLRNARNLAKTTVEYARLRSVCAVKAQSVHGPQDWSKPTVRARNPRAHQVSGRDLRNGVSEMELHRSVFSIWLLKIVRSNDERIVSIFMVRTSVGVRTRGGRNQRKTMVVALIAGIV